MAVFLPFLLLLAAAISYYDFRFLVIPNWLNAMVLAIGIAFRSNESLSALCVALVVGLATFGLFWLVRYSFWKWRGRIGLGMGDVKLAGAAGVWISPFNLPIFVFLAAFSGLVFLLLRSRESSERSSFRAPFGPFLAASLVLTWTAEQADFFVGSVL